VSTQAALDVQALGAQFSGRLLTDAAAMAPYLTDWRGKWQGQALAVAQPDTAEDAATIVTWCHAHDVPVVTQGGNTGLSGGSVPDATGNALVLSLTRLNRIRDIDVANNTMTVEAGCTLAQVQSAAQDAGRLFPLSLAAEGSCTIGGNLATNAGGVQVLSYGNARNLCLGLEVVLPDGALWNGLRSLRKDNTGYDLRDLFIGSEGTLGVITAAVLTLHPRPAGQVVALVAVADLNAAVEVLARAQARVGSGLTACELISHECLALVLRHVPTARNPLDSASPWYLLLEVSDGHDEARAREALESVLEAVMEQGLATDAALSASIAQFDALWALRENISEAQATEGKNIKHDIALPISRIPAFVEEAEAALLRQFDGLRLVVFGHLGDGNLHYNLSPAPGRTGPEHAAAFLAQEPAVNLLVHDLVARYGGSISAEHGLGVLRRDEAQRYRSPIEQRMMQAVKQALDPKGLMNPGKYVV
jgi:FAD/FMN-containing dehydrogenase